MEFGSFTLSDDISFVINKKDRIALAGKDGADKSIVLKVFTSLQSPTSGTISVPKEVTIGYLPQHMQLVDTHTVRKEAECTFEHTHEVGEEISRLNTQLAECTDYGSEGHQKLIDRATHLSEHFQTMEGDSCRTELERTSAGLGFSCSDFDHPTSEFGGDQHMCIELTKLLLHRPGVLLLDEPTNHLDIEPIQRLENFIATRANAVILISHDRAFIDDTTFRTLEIELGKIHGYKVRCSEYVVLRRKRREQQQRAHGNQQKKLADTEASIECFRYKATKPVQAQSRIEQLEKVKRTEVDDVDIAILRLKFPPAPRFGSYPAIRREVAKCYGGHPIFGHATLTINRDDKVTSVGKNGESKSTLVKCIIGEITDSAGELQLDHNVKIGYFAQNQAQLLNENLTVFDTIDYVVQGDTRLRIRSILGVFMFDGETSDKEVKVLSGGECIRLAMIRLLLGPVNLLIFDEPANHLDTRSKDVLKSALRESDGTVIVVSHDREFLDGLVDRIYELGNQKVVKHLGGTYDFLEHKKINGLRELECSTGTGISMSGIGEAQVPHNKFSYGARKKLGKVIKKAEKAAAEAEARISELENGIAIIEARLAMPEGAPDAPLYGECSTLEKELSDATGPWTRRTMGLEKLNTQDS